MIKYQRQVVPKARLICFLAGIHGQTRLRAHPRIVGNINIDLGHILILKCHILIRKTPNTSSETPPEHVRHVFFLGFLYLRFCVPMRGTYRYKTLFLVTM